jgi:hypothetical protein
VDKNMKYPLKAYHLFVEGINKQYISHEPDRYYALSWLREG